MKKRTNLPNSRAGSLMEELLYVRSVMEASSPQDISLARDVLDEYFLDYLFSYLRDIGIPLEENDIQDRVDFVMDRGGFKLLNTINDAKRHFRILRPFKHAKIVGVKLPYEHGSVTIGDSFSYPSGHAALSRYFALVLSDIYFERNKSQPLEVQKIELLNRANQIAWSRLVLGVHYLQDIKEGKRLADVYFEKYMRNKNVESYI